VCPGVGHTSVFDADEYTELCHFLNYYLCRVQCLCLCFIGPEALSPWFQSFWSQGREKEWQKWQTAISNKHSTDYHTSLLSRMSVLPIKLWIIEQNILIWLANGSRPSVIHKWQQLQPNEWTDLESYLFPMISSDNLFFFKAAQCSTKLLCMQFEVLCQVFFSNPLFPGIKLTGRPMQSKFKVPISK